MLERLHFEDRESWLAGRAVGIGGSEAAAVVGLSPWMTPLELWKLKLGAARPKDMTGNAAVAQGVKWEPVLRDLFAATHGEYRVEHHPFDILRQAERPWLFATLDGELVETESDRRGVLETKTATPNGKAGWDKWSDGGMPMHYYLQVLHQLLATGFDFARLFACLFSRDGSYTLKTYELEREDVAADLDWLLGAETEFYQKNIVGGAMPSMPLKL